jgi:hypothetical protein
MVDVLPEGITETPTELHIMNTEKSEIKKLKAQAKADFIAEATSTYITEEEADNEGRPLDYSFSPYDILMAELQQKAKEGHSFF